MSTNYRSYDMETLVRHYEAEPSEELAHAIAQRMTGGMYKHVETMREEFEGNLVSYVVCSCPECGNDFEQEVCVEELQN